MRTAISVGPYKGAGGTAGNAVYFADASANAYAVDAMTGKQIWTRKLDDHAAARSTGAPILHDGRLYAPVAGVSEENAAARPQYECCTFRGSLSALDANTGEVIWKAYTITEPPTPRGRSTTGAQLWGPAGAGVWSAPTIDTKRGSIYVATGNGYSDPPQRTSDAVLAFDLKTGKMKWASQVTPNDVWILGCGGKGQAPIPIAPKASVPIMTSPLRRSSPLCQAGAISLSFRKNQASAMDSIPTNRAQSCGNTDSAVAAESAESGALRSISSRPIFPPRII